jgi:hypothetical protein
MGGAWVKECYNKCVAVEPVSYVFTTQFRGEFISTSHLLKLVSTKITFPVLFFDTL